MIYNNDVPETFMKTGEGLTISDIKCSTGIIADDLTLISTKVNGLQKLIDAAEKYSRKWRFEFNPGKTTAITFGESTQVNNINKRKRQWFLNNVAINDERIWTTLVLISVEVSPVLIKPKKQQKRESLSLVRCPKSIFMLLD